MEGASVNHGDNITTNQGVDHLNLPPGYRFHPTNEEIITHCLVPKVMNSDFTAIAIGEVNLNRCEPWELPKKAKMGEEEWYFFCQKDRKYPTGMRTNRATESGYWKATGKDKEIYSKSSGNSRKQLIGMKKTLVFYRGRAPKGEKTDWVMHEFRLEGNYSFPQYSAKDEWVVCRVIHKNKTTRMDSSVEDLLDSPLLPPLTDPPCPENNERPNASNSTNININPAYSSNIIQDIRGTGLANYPMTTRTLDANYIYYNQLQMLPQNYSTTSFNPGSSYKLPNSLYYPQNPHHSSSTSTLGNKLHQQRFEYHFTPNVPISYNPKQIIDQALQRHCKVEQFSSNQPMVSRSQDTGMSTDITTEISSAKHESNTKDDVATFHEIEDGPLSDLDSFWS